MGASLDANVAGDITLALGEIHSTLTKMTRQLALLNAIPVYWRSGGSGVPTALTLTFDLGGPAQGYKWDLRRVCVYGPDVTAALAGTGFLWAGTLPVVSGPGFPTPIGELELLDKTTTPFPVPAYYSTGQNVIHYPEHFIFGINAGTNGANYIVSAGGVQYSDTAPIEIAT